MMERSSDAWEHQAFKDTITKATNVEIYYRALGFYLEEQPTLLTDLLQALTPRIDVNRVVRMFVKSDNIPLIKPFLLNVQSQNKREVNNALNDLLIEEEDYKTLRDSVNNHDLRSTTSSSSDRSLQTSTARTSDGRNRSLCQNKTSCSRTPSRPLLCLPSQRLSRIFCDT
jgi:hypothetical protein